MSMYSLLRNNSKPSEQDIEEAFQGIEIVSILLVLSVCLSNLAVCLAGLAAWLSVCWLISIPRVN